MIKIYKKGKGMTVPKGSLDKFLAAGWSLENGDEKPKKKSSGHHHPMPEEDSFTPVEDEDSAEEEHVEVDPEELASRDLSELDMDELKILAEYKGLDISGLTTTRKLRAALEALE